MTDNERTAITVELAADEYAQLAADAAQRGISLEALLATIIDVQLRRWRQAERHRH